MGPTESMDKVIADINYNSQRVPTLWTQLDYHATFVDPQKNTTTNVAGDGLLMYSRPVSLLLNGDKDVAGQVFQVGSNDEEFWLKVRTSVDTSNYWWGHYANLGKPGTKPIPIRPDLVVEVLGVGLFQPDLLRQPVPVMRFDNEADAYVFDFNIRTANRWETREEIWYDRASKLPVRVLLFGSEGRVVLKADLSDHTPLLVPGVPREQCPKIARQYDLVFPENGDQISFTLLNDPVLQNKGRRGVLFPNARSFDRPDYDEHDKVIQIDANSP